MEELLGLAGNAIHQDQMGDAQEDPCFAEQNAVTRSIAASWILEGSPMRDLILVRVMMEPNMAVLRRQLHVSSERWERDQDSHGLREAKELSRDFRLLVSARGELDTLFATHQAMVFSSPSLFSLMPSEARTEQCLCLGFRMCSKSGAEYERTLSFRHRRPPFRLLLAFQQPQIVPELKALFREEPCCLDKFTLAFMSVFDLATQEARAVLQLLLVLGCADTANVECWHAWSRRVVQKLGTQTHRPNFFDVSARCVAKRVKRRSAQQAIWATGLPPLLAASSGHSLELPKKVRTEDGAPLQKRARGGGGPWRAHCSREFRAGASDLKEVRARYDQRTPEQVEADEAEGRAATERHRVGLPAFGPTKKALQQQQVRNEAIAFNRRHVLQESSFIEEQAAALTPVMKECTATSFAHFLKVVRKVGSLERADQKATERLALEVIKDFAKGPGVELLSEIVGVFPMLARLKDSLMAMPPNGGLCGHVRFAARSADMAQRAFAIDAAPGHKFRQCTLGSCLDAYWASRHRPIFSGEWTGPELRGVAQETACFKAGHCLCCTDGRRLYRFRNSFLRAMKSLTQKDTAERGLLMDGMLVWRLRGRPRESFFGAQEDSEDSDPNNYLDTIVFWHVAAMSLSPYQPVFQVLLCDAIGEGGCLPGGQELPVTATWAGGGAQTHSAPKCSAIQPCRFRGAIALGSRIHHTQSRLRCHKPPPSQQTGDRLLHGRV